MRIRFLGATGTITGSKYPVKRAAAMLEGAAMIKIFGEYVPLHTQVTQIDNLSAHADGDEILSWLSHFRRAAPADFHHSRRAGGGRRIAQAHRGNATLDLPCAGIS